MPHIFYFVSLEILKNKETTFLENGMILSMMQQKNKAKNRMLSGVKPTGRPHIGNYLGAMRQFVELQEEFESFVMIADYHALTTTRDPFELSNNTIGVALDYLAIGLDPKKTVIFKQSDVPEHTELAWIFNCITTMPYLMRAHAFKDAQAKSKEISVGVFDYPMLMAADILLYEPDVVPVGQDQKQHIEIARDTAEKFNRLFGKTFSLPKEHTIKDASVVPGIDGRKMSKGYNNTIPLFAEDEEIAKQVMSIVTDSKGERDQKDPTICGIFALHKFFSENELFELKKRYIEGAIGYKESKEILTQNLTAFIAPLREKRKVLARDTDAIISMLEDGAKRARKEVRAKMQEVRGKIGVDFS